jgi:hypothetical protein
MKKMAYGLIQRIEGAMSLKVILALRFHFFQPFEYQN